MLDSDHLKPSKTVSSAPPSRNWRLLAQRTFALSFALGITLLIYLNRNSFEEYEVYRYPGVFIISLLGNATLILPAPSFLIVFALADTLNPVWLGLAAGLGAATGEMTGYLAGYGGRGVVEDKPLYQRIADLMRTWGAWLIFVLALLPNPFFDVGGILAGILRIYWWKFWLAAAVGKSLRFIVLAYFGEALLSWFK